MMGTTMNDGYFMAVKSIGLSKVGGRKGCTLETAAKHNKRELVQELAERGRIDASRTPQNFCLAGAADSDGVSQLAMQLMASIGTSPDKKRRDFCQAVEVVFSLPAATTIDIVKYFGACAAWCGERFGAETILSADVHLDESYPHCHVLIAPIHDGRWAGGKLIDRASTRALWESFRRNVAMAYGLRMADRLTGARKSGAVALALAWVETQDSQLFRSPLWQPIRQALERNPEPFIAAMGLILPDRPEPKLKTMAQVFTGRGKGPKLEPLPAGKSNLIGIDDSGESEADAKSIGIANEAENDQSLSCVGIASSSPASVPTKQAIEVWPEADDKPHQEAPKPSPIATTGSRAKTLQDPGDVTRREQELNLKVAKGSQDLATEITRERDEGNETGTWSGELGEFIASAQFGTKSASRLAARR